MTTVYPDEPRNAAELLARYREVKRRLYPVARQPSSDPIATRDAENIVALAVAVAAVTADRARESAKGVNVVSAADVIKSPASAAKAALRAVSQRTGVPVDAILGRERRSAIAAARHEAVWRVHEATKWSLPRVGRFFDDRDHTTVLHSLRRMENRAAKDPELRAYMTLVRRMFPSHRPSAGH